MPPKTLIKNDLTFTSNFKAINKTFIKFIKKLYFVPWSIEHV